MAKKVWIILISCFCLQLLDGAEVQKKKVEGLVIDNASGRPVEFADVAIYQAMDSVFVAGCVVGFADG